jgi:hypothetical protein
MKLHAKYASLIKDIFIIAQTAFGLLGYKEKQRQPDVMNIFHVLTPIKKNKLLSIIKQYFSEKLD